MSTINDVDPQHKAQSRPCSRTKTGVTSRRTTRACDDCRRLKEKCIGKVPCDRCTKSGRPCQFSDSFKRTRVPRKVAKIRPERSASPDTKPSDFFDVDRIKDLEAIVRFYTGIHHCSRESLRNVVEMAQWDGSSPEAYHEWEASDGNGNGNGNEVVDVEAISPAPSDISAHGEISHLDFSLRLQKEVKDQLDCSSVEDSTHLTDSAPSTHLLSRDSVILEAASLFPPAQSALLLVDVFFEFAQTNYFYVDEETLRKRLDDFYSSSGRVGMNDAPWVCTALMVFALGTQFSHLYQSSSRSPRGRVAIEAYTVCQSMDDTLSVALYRKASNLIPDILAIASLESIQAFVLLGIYVLPIDPAGLSCTYFGIAIKAATQAGMHRRTSQDGTSRETELRKRVWWTAYVLERRISILHGRPVSISRLDVGANLPVDIPELQPRERASPFQNNVAMLKLTNIMEYARDAILALKNGDKIHRSRRLRTLEKVRETLQTYWQSLPEETFCRDLKPGKPLFRSNIHLALTYHLIHIFIGRSFIFDETLKHKGSPHLEWQSLRKRLIDDCVSSAVATIDLCQVLHDESLLSKSSYTEFTCCCAAVLALVAKCVVEKNTQLRDISKKGTDLLKSMSIGVFSTSSEKRAVENLEKAFEKLDHASEGRDDRMGVDDDSDGYAQFTSWVAMQQIVPGETLQLPRQESTMFDLLTAENQTMTMNRSGMNALGLSDLSSVPDLSQWLDHGFF